PCDAARLPAAPAPTATTWTEPRPSPAASPRPFPSPSPAAARAPEPQAASRQPPCVADRWSLDPSAFPWLHAHGRNLTELAANGRLDPAIGRDAEVEEVLDILGKRRANNPVLVGEPGVGKTAIVEGLAQRLFELDRKSVV